MTDTLRILTDDSGPTAGVVTIFLDDESKPVTVLNRAMLARLDAALDGVERANPAGVVLATSHGRVFVAGADLKEISELPDGELDEYLAYGQRVLGRIAGLGCTTVAAINGAALGGGLELALHCDVLLAMEPEKPDKPYRVGLPEASLGLCPGWGGTNTLPARIEPGVAIGATACGSTFTFDEAVEYRLFESVHAGRESLLAAARSRASKRKVGRNGGPNEPINVSMPEYSPSVRTALARVRGDVPKDDAAEAVLTCVEAGLQGGWAGALEQERKSLIALRGSESAQAKIKAFFDRNTSR